MPKNGAPEQVGYERVDLRETRDFSSLIKNLFVLSEERKERGCVQVMSYLLRLFPGCKPDKPLEGY